MTNLTNLRQTARHKIIERADMVSAGQPGRVHEVAFRHARSWGIRGLDWTVQGPPVHARIDAGRWCVMCEDCGGGEYASLDEPLFWCCSCANVANDHRPRPVVFPDAAERGRIESVLLLRTPPLLPGGQSPRHWRPGQSVTELVAENVAAGDPVPDWSS